MHRARNTFLKHSIAAASAPHLWGLDRPRRSASFHAMASKSKARRGFTQSPVSRLIVDFMFMEFVAFGRRKADGFDRSARSNWCIQRRQCVQKRCIQRRQCARTTKPKGDGHPLIVFDYAADAFGITAARSTRGFPKTMTSRSIRSGHGSRSDSLNAICR